jgi:CRISPR/Cas system-associated exonuclease Cas4 (RecB family)
MLWVGCFALGALGVLLLASCWVARRAASERGSRPAELARAQLVYMERLFRIERPIGLRAKVDRAYRLRGGSLVLVELKTRGEDRTHLSDIIQLSAQRLAIEAETGQKVEPYAFVSVLEPTRRRALRHHRVDLLGPDEVVALSRWRDALLAGQAAPRYALSCSVCARCAYNSRCDRPGRPDRG